MSEDRTQAPTKRRRQLAREQGQVARSALLTTAVGLLAATMLLGAVGAQLSWGLTALVRAPLIVEEPSVPTGPAELVTRVRNAVVAVGAPVFGTLLGIVIVMVLAHQVQVGGLWVPSLLAPRPERLMAGWNAGDPFGRLVRALLGILQAACLVGLTIWILQRNTNEFQRLPTLAPSEVPSVAGHLVLEALRSLAILMLAFGAIDYLLIWNRVEAQLQQTPDEYREDLKALDGDPAVRARRRRLAESWRVDASEVLPGATVCLGGANGLAVLLGGGPPPKPVTVRQITRGVAAAQLQRQAERAGVPLVTAPTLAAHFARGRAGGTALPPALADELRALWPHRGPGA